MIDNYLNITVLELTQKTLDFIKEVKTLKESGDIKKFGEIVDALNWNKASLSNVLNGRENISDFRYSEFKKHFFQNNSKPPDPYIEQRRNQKNIIKAYMAYLLPVKAYAGYVKSYDQTDYLNTLEQYALPPGINPIGAIWRYFEVGGDSMEPTFKSGDVILCTQVAHEDWTQLRNFYIYVIVTADKVMVKRVFSKSPMQWVLISDNEKQYPQQLQDVSEVKELWVFRRHISSKASPPKEFKIKI